MPLPPPRLPLVHPAQAIPGDYRIGGVLLSVAAFLGPVCHLWQGWHSSGWHFRVTRTTLALGYWLLDAGCWMLLSSIIGVLTAK